MENENLRPAAEEEEEMETFFALVRNFKEMRDRRRKEMATVGDGGEADQAPEKKRKKMKTAPAPATWIPTFLREDFDEDFQVRGPPPVLPMPCNLIKEDTTAAAAAVAAMKKKKKKMKSDDDEECLDLNLAL